MNIPEIGDTTRAGIKPEPGLLLRLTDYYRRVQVAAALESLKDQRDGSGDEERKENIIRSSFSQTDFEQGICPQSVWGRAFKKIDEQRLESHTKELRRNPNAVMPEPAQNITVVFSPFGLSIEGERESVNVVFGTASVDRNGVMTTAEVDSDLPPVWIGRSCLSPTEGLEDDIFPLADADEYYNQIAAELKELETWPSAWDSVLRACDRIWKKTGTEVSPLFKTLSEKYTVTAGWIRFEDRDSKKLTIIRLYEKICERVLSNNVEPLYQEAALGQHRVVFSEIKTQLHLGQMGADYPLAPSQRSSLLAYLQTGSGHITAVNGPPGTGKTTLLQSVVATEMVSHAIEESHAPLYIAGAVTNQAVSNIIKAFREATENLTHPLAERWIPGLGRRYGVYFRAKSGEGLTLAKGSLVCIPSNLTSHKTYNDEEIKQKIEDIKTRNEDQEEVAIDLFLAIGESQIARDYFLEQSNQLLNHHFDTLESVRSHLHGRLRETQDRIIKYCAEADSLTALISKLKIDDCDTYDLALQRLKERQQISQEKFNKLSRRHQVEHTSDSLREREQKRVEKDELESLLSNQKAIEKVETEKENTTKNRLLRQEKEIDEITKRYEGLGEPITFWSWLSERYFPWTKNAKIAQIKSVIEWAKENHLGSPDAFDVLSMRKHIESVIGMKHGIVQKNLQIDQAAFERRNTAKKKGKAFAFAINENRNQREAALKQRDDERTRERQVVQLLLQKDLRAIHDLQSQFEQFEKKCREILDEDAPHEFDKIVGKIDTTLRVEAFLLATHYWECRFLLEVEKSGWRSQMNRRETFKVIAMLAPCFVSTFDKMGTAFNIKKQDVIHPMWGLADTLIIDEAGQASPDKGAFAFALAKKAIVVGDNLQLPPVGSTDAGTILTSIARSSGILDSRFVTSRGLLSGKVGVQQADGSIMRMASAAAFYDMSRTTQGMWLRDHFRCDPRIIEFCNQIWYTGETSLVPRRVRKKESFVPHFGHVNVIGKNNNKSNQSEVEAIMTWIDAHGQDLQEHYQGKPLHEIVAVLTPFSNQKKLLRKIRDKFAWSSAYEYPEKIVMGTVHALQGAEREVVLFSTVYDRPQSSYFFDREHTLLNVAVSRAKDSFIVFGNRSLFPKGMTDTSQPSTLLRDHLMNEELFEVPPLPKSKIQTKTA